MHRHARSLALTLLLAAATLAGGCGSKTPSPPAPSSANAAWLLAEMPAGAVGVAEAKKGASEGDAVIVRGRIGGRRDPLGADAAVFVMMDAAIPTCADRHGDQCRTPWDYCCETPASIAANNATVQIVDGAGRPLPIDVGAHGLAPLDEVVVVGTVGPRDTEAMLVIRATGVHKIARSG